MSKGRRVMDSNTSPKIGILTHYYNNSNYGGNLQAYALVKFLKEKGYLAEQVCFIPCFTEQKQIEGRSMLNRLISKMKRSIFHPCQELVVIPKRKRTNKTINPMEKRMVAVCDFNSNIIPHGTTIYDSNNICEANNEYDCFITGSDQVWNLNWYEPAFFLNFVEEKKKKISYAASMAMDNLTEEQKAIVKQHLEDFS